MVNTYSSEKLGMGGRQKTYSEFDEQFPSLKETVELCAVCKTYHVRCVRSLNEIQAACLDKNTVKQVFDEAEIDFHGAFEDAAVRVLIDSIKSRLGL